MRAVLSYVLAVAALTVYGVQVCPFLESLPGATLAGVIFAGFALALALRFPLQNRLVLAAPPTGRAGRQFALDLGLCLAAGLGVAVFDRLAFGFPWLSGVKLLVGCLVLGYFLGLDLALARERQVILSALAEGGAYLPPERFFPLTRRFLWAAVGTVLAVTLVMGLVLLHDLEWLISLDLGPGALAGAALDVGGELAFVMAVLLALVLTLIASYSGNLRLLFDNQTRVLKAVSGGDLSRKVPVATSDEFGLIAGHTNLMIDGLRHRSRLVEAIRVAEEIQRNLLPAGPPAIPGLDLAAVSLPSEETNGDYFDYVPLADGAWLLAVGDVTGHGVGAAMLMAGARAYLRSAAEGRGATDLAWMAAEVNRQLCRDVGESGRFMTLFLLAVAADGQALNWVRAGHDPGLIYDPARGEFSELLGPGMALGILPGAEFSAGRWPGLPQDGVLLIASDGLWEAHEAHGEMFGKERVRAVLGSTAGRPATAVVQALVAAQAEFLAGAPREDDVTLVVVTRTGAEG